MEYILHCQVGHGICWNGGHRTYEGNVTIDFTPEEIEQLKTTLNSADQREVCEQIEEDLPQLYRRIQATVRDFLDYTVILNLCVTGQWQEGNEDEDLTERQLMQEDLDAHRFQPLYVNEGTPDALIESQWFLWMVHQLSELPYRQRTEYLCRRYHLNPDDLKEIGDDDFEFSFEIYKEVK